MNSGGLYPSSVEVSSCKADQLGLLELVRNEMSESSDTERGMDVHVGNELASFSFDDEK